MKAIKFTALLLAITAMVACQKDNNPTPDPMAVKLTATVSSPFTTRSNPIDDASSAVFKVGDTVAVVADNQGEVKYTLSEGNAWTPEAGKYLKWDAEAMTFKAYYPARANQASMSAFDLPADQSTIAKIEQTDYMTYTSPAPEAKAESVNLALTRHMARVVIGIKFLDTRIGSTVEKIEVHSNTNGYKDGALKSGQITIAPLMHTDSKFYALLSPTTADAATDFLTLTVKKADGTPETIHTTGIPALEAGKSYAFDLEVGNNKVKITNVTVTDWTTGKVIPGGDAMEINTADPDTHTVHLAKMGALTDALIIKAIAGVKDLKITGAMGPADFATLLKWGTDGLKNSDADRLHNLDLTGVTGLTAVPKFAFAAIVEEEVYYLRSLQYIALPSTVTSVEHNAFVGCSSLAEFTAPNVQAVADNAFNGCTSLTKFDAPNVQTLGEEAFNNCTSLAEVTAPELQTIGNNAFGNCTVLKKFTATKLRSASEYAFDGCTSLTEFTAIKLRTVESSAFSGCTSLVTFTAPELQTVGAQAFVNCTSLATVTAPKLQTVESFAFSNCASLAEVTAPKLKTVGELAFSACNKLTELLLTTDANIELADNAFAGTPSDKCTLYLHDNKNKIGYSTPKVDDDGQTWGGRTWKEIIYVNAKGEPAGTADPITHTVNLTEQGVLTKNLITTAMNGGKDLVITGKMVSVDFATLLKWGTEGYTNSDADLIHNLDLRGLVESIEVPSQAFYTVVSDKEYSLRSLRHIELSADVTKVEGQAFAGCTSLTEFTAPNVSIVRSQAFTGCTSLTKFTAPKMEQLESYAFANCTSLAEFKAPKLVNVDKRAFQNCSLTKLHLTTAANINIDEFAFTGFVNSGNCTLYLHENKKNGGSSWPLVDADGKWCKQTWKNIVYVNDNGVVVP